MAHDAEIDGREWEDGMSASGIVTRCPASQGGIDFVPNGHQPTDHRAQCLCGWRKKDLR